ncbi:hypothetical protein DT076_16570 [Desertihabitans brevis]|uniref:Phage tail protein n=1 Tax=Desertihabitans brevis TaxID=2268447 RepID=A0A367YTA7_9ACTN|nr:hypothetical protein DT076_16570 [Desertihabitans brevis]
MLWSGVRGFAMPPFRQHKQTAPAVAGARWRGYSTDEREVFWPLEVYTSAGTEAWLSLDREFWQTMHPGKTGLWSVITPSGQARHLRLRFTDDGNPEFQDPPERVGWHLYGITLHAEQPFWTGEPIRQAWSRGVDLPFVPETGAPPFNISATATLETANITNPGDEDAYPVWTLYGPITSAWMGVGDSRIHVPFTLQEGEFLRVDTAPTDGRAMFGQIPYVPGKGIDRTADLGPSTEYAEIPPGERRKLSLDMEGTGTVEVSLTPLYHRAW